MSGKILVYIDQFKGAALPTSWEVLSAAYTLAEKLGSSVTGIALGMDSKAVAEQTFLYGPEEVFYCDDASLADSSSSCCWVLGGGLPSMPRSRARHRQPRTSCVSRSFKPSGRAWP